MKLKFYGTGLKFKLSTYIISPFIVLSLLLSLEQQAAATTTTAEKLQDPLYLCVIIFIGIFGLSGASIARNIKEVDKKIEILFAKLDELEKKQSKTCILYTKLKTTCENHHPQRGSDNDDAE